MCDPSLVTGAKASLVCQIVLLAHK